MLRSPKGGEKALLLHLQDGAAHHRMFSTKNEEEEGGTAYFARGKDWGQLSERRERPCFSIWKKGSSINLRKKKNSARETRFLRLAGDTVTQGPKKPLRTWNDFPLIFLQKSAVSGTQGISLGTPEKTILYGEGKKFSRGQVSPRKKHELSQSSLKMQSWREKRKSLRGGGRNSSSLSEIKVETFVKITNHPLEKASFVPIRSTGENDLCMLEEKGGRKTTHFLSLERGERELSTKNKGIKMKIAAPPINGVRPPGLRFRGSLGLDDEKGVPLLANGRGGKKKNEEKGQN